MKATATVSAVENPCSQSTLCQTAAILSNFFHSVAAWEYWNIIMNHMSNESSHITETKRSVFAGDACLQRCLVSKNLFFYPLGTSIYTQECFAKPGKRFLRGGHEHCLATTYSLLKTTWNKLIQCLSGSVLVAESWQLRAWQSLLTGRERFM